MSLPAPLQAHRLSRTLRRTALPLLLLMFLGKGAATNAAQEFLHRYLAQLQTTYTPPGALQEQGDLVTSLREQLELTKLPRLTLTEQFTWSGRAPATLAADLTALLPLYRGEAAALNAVQEKREELLAAELALAADEARAQFISDLLYYALLTQLEADVTQALLTVEGGGWQPPASAEEALLIPPPERALLHAWRQASELLALVTDLTPRLEARLAASLGAPIPTELPSFRSLATATDTHLESPAACGPDSLTTRVIVLGSELELLEQIARGVPPTRVDLHASAHYSPGRASGNVGVSARVPLPLPTTLTGQLEANVDLAGVTQSLSVSWPAETPHDLQHPRSIYERRVEVGLAALADDLLDMQHHLNAATRAAEEAEMQLLFALQDLHGPYPPMELLELLQRPTGDAVTDLQLIQLDAEAGFAQLARTEAALLLALACSE